MLINELLKLQESIKIVYPPEYSSGAAKAAYKLGYQGGYSRKPSLSKESVMKSFGVYEPYFKGHADGQRAEEHEAWQEKNAAGRTYHEDVEEKPNTVILSKADEFKIELEKDSEQVNLIDGEGTIRVSMPLVIWKQLSRG